ncbi:hypothetical protein Q3G72_000028 [Acer saccharum]|nr:hypothetical protein Q3G72_000028 [Acer saccharum]
MADGLVHDPKIVDETFTPPIVGKTIREVKLVKVQKRGKWKRWARVGRMSEDQIGLTVNLGNQDVLVNQGAGQNSEGSKRVTDSQLNDFQQEQVLLNGSVEVMGRLVRPITGRGEDCLSETMEVEPWLVGDYWASSVCDTAKPELLPGGNQEMSLQIDTEIEISASRFSPACWKQ